MKDKEAIEVLNWVCHKAKAKSEFFFFLKKRTKGEEYKKQQTTQAIELSCKMYQRVCFKSLSFMDSQSVLFTCKLDV